MPRLFTILVCCVGLVGTSALNAEDLVVNNRLGNDQNDGSPAAQGAPNSGPIKTIAVALKKAKKGDRVVIQKTDLPYRECLTLQGARNSGTTLLPFRLESDGAIIDGTETIPAQIWEHHRGNVFRFQPRLMSHQLLYMDGRPAEQIKLERRGIIPQLEPLQWALVDGWIYFRTESGRIPSQYDLAYCHHQAGITLYQVRNVVIEGLIVQGFQLDGINAHDSVTATEIRSCTLRGNGRAGLPRPRTPHR